MTLHMLSDETFEQQVHLAPCRDVKDGEYQIFTTNKLKSKVLCLVAV
jgi:hypothetical protein